MSTRTPVYDTGMLIALAARKAKAVQMHRGLTRSPHRPVVPGPVLAQVWRPDPATVHVMGAILKERSGGHRRLRRRDRCRLRARGSGMSPLARSRC
ncbi:hypothetical protein PWG71_27485 [Nocardiopsis sp. N85]|uniref:hypothetical protein n=1 Tax=Nocardiopsis sp. N85 TaxID=3029400 RepID=UPI00237EF5C8|nr:hypothetical protein [Nocardiopsis sp. N85]MDE3725140.1 hypothetical protein [Nocardiopsis sp. N85]